MHPQIESIFDEAENRYLKPEELSFLGQYVDSLPERLGTYRLIRDHELEIMQAVADQLQVEMPDEKVEHLERSIKNALLMLRCCAMGMLLNDEVLVRERLINWLGQTMKIYNTQALDSTLYRLLDQQLNQVLNPKQMMLINAMLTLAQDALLGQETLTASALGW